MNRRAVFTTLGNGMKFIVTADDSEIFKQTNQLLTMIIVAILIVSVIAVTIALFITRKMTKPINSLTDAAAKSRTVSSMLLLSVPPTTISATSQRTSARQQTDCAIIPIT